MKKRLEIETTEELASWYDKKYVEMGGCWHTPVEEINRHLDALAVPNDKALKLLDIGCGDGSFIQEANKRVTCAGVEVSRYAFDKSQEKGLDTHLLSAEKMDIFSDGEFDFVVSMGSLEHIVDLGAALDEIRRVLKGKFMFYCPNEEWTHTDQPNERTAASGEWMALFIEHGLQPSSAHKINDNTRFIGEKKT